MASYTIELGPDHEDAVSYALEQIQANADESQGPFEVPTRQQFVAQAIHGGLVGPYSLLQGEGEKLVELLRRLEPPAREAVVAQIASLALRAYVTRRLAQDAGG